VPTISFIWHDEDRGGLLTRSRAPVTELATLLAANFPARHLPPPTAHPHPATTDMIWSLRDARLLPELVKRACGCDPAEQVGPGGGEHVGQGRPDERARVGHGPACERRTGKSASYIRRQDMGQDFEKHYLPQDIDLTRCDNHNRGSSATRPSPSSLTPSLPNSHPPKPTQLKLTSDRSTLSTHPPCSHPRRSHPLSANPHKLRNVSVCLLPHPSS